MQKLQPNIDLARKKLLKNKDIFLESNLKLIQGHSSKVQKFARKGLASLGAVEVSSKFRKEVVLQSKILCEDYVYNRLSRMLHHQQKRYLGQESQQQDTDDDNNSSNSNHSNNNSNNNNRQQQQQQQISSIEEDDEIDSTSSPDKLGQIRYEKWRNCLPEVSTRIQVLGSKLEKAYPYLYDGLGSQLKMPLRSEASINKALTCIGDFMFKNSSITWYRVVGMFAVVGAMALEAVDHDDGKLIKSMITIFSQVIDRHVALWVCNQGGWAALVRTYEPATQTYKFLIALVGFFVSFSLLIALPITFFEDQIT